MFRYLGFGWNPAAPTQAAVAQRLAEAIQGTDGWRMVYSSPGLCISTIGCHTGVNDIYPLPRAKGVVLGRLFRRREHTSGKGIIDLSGIDGQCILQTGGRALVEDYWGRYVAILRLSQAGAHVLRDPSGALPCFKTDVEGVTVFFSWLEDLRSFTPNLTSPRVNWDAIVGVLALGHLGGRETALQGVSQVLPGQLTTLDNRGASSLTLWSATAFAGHPIESEPRVAVAQLRCAVIDCVSAWSSTYDSVLLRLSGGVDSAILLASLNACDTKTQLTCLNYYSSGSSSDERKFARLAAAKAGVNLIERERDVDFRLDDVLNVSRTPAPETYIGRMGTGRSDAEVASVHCARALFTGGGGDQLFFQFRCTWPAADYLGRHGPGRGFFRASLDAARLGNVSLWQSMWRALADQRHRTSPLDDAGKFRVLAHREALDSVRRLERYVHPELLGETGLPIGKFHQLQEMINPAGYYDPYLREVSPEPVNPLLSQPLAELCLSLPTWLLTHGGIGRALARQAFASELPREIATRQSKGGMEEHVKTILKRNLPFVRALLLDGHLVRQGLLDRNKVEAALDGRLSSLGGHVGEIHNCVAIEAWLLRALESSTR